MPGFCPIPHTFRDQVWLAVGAFIGAAVGVTAVVLYTKPKRSKNTVPRAITESALVVDLDSRLKINEYVGNASSGDPRISIAKACVLESNFEEAIQCPGFDEYIFVLSGTMKVYTNDPKSLKGVSSEDAKKNSLWSDSCQAKAGEMLYLPKGYLYRYTFLEPTEYIPICLPAFKPEISGLILSEKELGLRVY